jgi:hypothetical protein
MFVEYKWKIYRRSYSLANCTIVNTSRNSISVPHHKMRVNLQSGPYTFYLSRVYPSSNQRFLQASPAFARHLRGMATTNIQVSPSGDETAFKTVTEELKPLLRSNGGRWKVSSSQKGIERSFQFKTFKKTWVSWFGARGHQLGHLRLYGCPWCGFQVQVSPSQEKCLDIQ